MSNFRVEDGRNLPVFIHSEFDDYGLDPYEVRVYLRLVRRAGAAGTAYESVGNMARACKMSDRRVQYALQVLCALKIIEKVAERVGETSIYALQDVGQWLPSGEVERVRTRILKRKAKRSLAKDPSPIADTPPYLIHPTSVPDSPPPPYLIHPTSVPDAPKGSPLKVTPLEGSPLKIDDDEQKKIENFSTSFSDVTKAPLEPPPPETYHEARAAFAEFLRAYPPKSTAVADVWLNDVSAHVREFGVERVKSAVKVTVTNPEVKNPWHYYEQCVSSPLPDRAGYPKFSGRGGGAKRPPPLDIDALIEEQARKDAEWAAANGGWDAA